MSFVETVTKEAPKPRCRIPQRLPPIRQKPHGNVESMSTKTKTESNHPPARTTPKYAMRPRSNESRPRSSTPATASDDRSGKSTAQRSPHQDRDKNHTQQQTPKKATPKKEVFSYLATNKGRSNTSSVPGAKKTWPCYSGHVKSQRVNINNVLPDQETIKKSEDLEVKTKVSDLPRLLSNVQEQKLLGSNDTFLSVKSSWDMKVTQFDQMKTELDMRQRAIVELYASLRDAHKAMTAFGQPVTLPAAEELQILNVAKMTPNQLLQLCVGANQLGGKLKGARVDKDVELNKLYDIPKRLVAVCEQTLVKRKEIIDWFETLKSEEKGISMNKLSKKINEFNVENQMLNNALQSVKEELLKDLNEIVDYLRKDGNEAVAQHLRTEELMYELSELNSQNADLKKQLHTAEQMKSQSNRHRVEELEKELKEERCKKMVIKDRLSRSEGQLKISNERAAQLEAALEQTRSQNWTLERTVQQLHEQNQKLQSDFDQELCKLTESIRANTMHLEDIAVAREKLQSEKDALEKRLQQLSETYNESLETIKNELNIHVEKLKETEKKFDSEKEERLNLETKLESIYSQLLESELRYKEVVKQLQEKDTQLAELQVLKLELTDAKQKLEGANLEVEEYRDRLMKQGDTIREIERNFKDTINLEKKLRNDLKNKDEYIIVLEQKQSILERQLEEGEAKMSSYEEQLSTIKDHISQLRAEFGEFESLTQLHDMINQQRAKLLEATRQNGELAEALQKKDAELESNLEHLTKQEQLLEKRENLIKMLQNKEEEQSNIIKLLRSNLEIRTQADTELTTNVPVRLDSDSIYMSRLDLKSRDMSSKGIGSSSMTSPNMLSRQVAEKTTEIEALLATLETRKKQISQLEQIILTLEDQLRKNHSQRRKDQEKVNLLERALNEFESLHIESRRKIETPVDNLDNLIKILEDELGTTFEPDIKENDLKIKTKKTYISEQSKKETLQKFECHDGDSGSVHQADRDKSPTKKAMGNFVKKSYLSAGDEQHKGDNLDRKIAITNMDTHKWPSKPEPEPVSLHETSHLPRDISQLKGIPVVSNKDQYLSRNMQFLMFNQRDEKKCKMFKFAGHRL